MMLDPQVFKLQSDRTEEYIRVIRENCSENTQLVMMIMPTSRDDRYNSVKKLLCCERPCPSQVSLYGVCQSLVAQWLRLASQGHKMYCP